MTSANTTYFAVPDPEDASVVTYWRRDRRRLVEWPARSSWGPRLHVTDIPSGLDEVSRRWWILQWARTVRAPWDAAIEAAIDADPDLAAARFAALTTRCCSCGRKLVSPASKVEAIGPECRSGPSRRALDDLRAAVSRAHAEHLS